MKLSLLLLAFSAPAFAQSFTTDKPMVHDPVMAKSGDTYYMMSTGHGLQMAESKDLKTWRVWRDAPLLTAIPAWTHDSVPGFRDHVWAPDIIHWQGRWWMTYSCSTFGKNTSAIGMVSTDTLRPLSDDGRNLIEWRDEGPIICSRGGRDNWNAIDPNFIIGEDGMLWLTFGSFWDGIQLVRLDSTMRIDRSFRQRTIARRKTEGRANPVEAPFIFRHGGWFYLFVSWDYCCRGMESTYKVVVGRSCTVAGPYLDREGRDMALGGGTLVIEGDKKQYEAAGHSAAYRFGDEDIFICHGYSIADNGASVLVKKTMDWTEDGWPVLR